MGFAVVWVLGGIAMATPATASCLTEFARFGLMTAIGDCLPLPGLALVLSAGLKACTTSTGRYFEATLPTLRSDVWYFRIAANRASAIFCR